MDVFVLEDGISNEQAIACAKAQQQFAIVARWTCLSKAANAACPVLCLAPHFGVEVTKQEQLMGGRGAVNGVLQLAVEEGALSG